MNDLSDTAVTEPLVLVGEPLPARPGVLCSSCNARKGLSQRRR
jgi:hypothetical protein